MRIGAYHVVQTRYLQTECAYALYVKSASVRRSSGERYHPRVAFFFFFKVYTGLKGELHLKPKLSMFYALAQNFQHCFEEQLY